MSAKQKRILIGSVIGAVVVLGLGVAFTPRAIRVDLAVVDGDSMVVSVEEEGKTRIHDVFVLSAPVAGRLQRIEAHVGDPVTGGVTVLGRIEPSDPSLLDPRSEAEARAAVKAATAARELAAAAVDEAVAELDFADTELRRANELVADGTIARRAFDEAERAYRTRSASLATARASLQMRQFELDQAKARLLSPTQTRTSSEECDCVPITAPISGRLLSIVNDSERLVVAGEPLVEIGDPRHLEIVVDFLSTDAVRIRSGQRVVIDGFGGDHPLEGSVRRVEPFGFTKVSALGIEEQRVNVIIDFEGEPEDWHPLGHGYQVETSVVLWEGKDVLTVPLTALFRQGDRWAVFTQRGRRARLSPVEIGRRNGLVAEVVSGLEVGDQVVIHPSDRVLDGVRVAARTAS